MFVPATSHLHPSTRYLIFRVVRSPCYWHIVTLSYLVVSWEVCVALHIIGLIGDAARLSVSLDDWDRGPEMKAANSDCRRTDRAPKCIFLADLSWVASIKVAKMVLKVTVFSEKVDNFWGHFGRGVGDLTTWKNGGLCSRLYLPQLEQDEVIPMTARKYYLFNNSRQ